MEESYRSRYPMTFSHLARALLVVALATAGGCENAPNKSGVPWWPQGPGNPVGSEPATNDQSMQSTAQAAAAQPWKEASATAVPASVARDGETLATRQSGLLFLSGQTAAEAGDITQQTHAVMQKIGALLTAYGMTMANVVHVTAQLAHIEDLQAMDAAYSNHFRTSHPARTVAEVAHLPADALVQITVVAER